jgi:hypothetical protein
MEKKLGSAQQKMYSLNLFFPYHVPNGWLATENQKNCSQRHQIKAKKKIR